MEDRVLKSESNETEVEREKILAAFCQSALVEVNSLKTCHNWCGQRREKQGKNNFFKVSRKKVFENKKNVGACGNRKRQTYRDRWFNIEVISD